MGTVAAQNPDDRLDTIERQLLVEYQILQNIADHEVQTVYLTFAVFVPLLVTPAAALLAVLFSGNLDHPWRFVTLGLIGTVATIIFINIYFRLAESDKEKAVRAEEDVRTSGGDRETVGGVYAKTIYI